MAAGLAHPVRASMTLGALVVGVAAVTFAVGLNRSLLRVVGQLERDVASPVRVELPPGRASTHRPWSTGPSPPIPTRRTPSPSAT